MNLKKITAALAVTATTLTAFADVKVNDNLTVSGYAAGAYTYYKANGAPSIDSLFDAGKAPPGAGDANDVLVRFSGNFKPVTGVVSINYFPGIPDIGGAKNELTLLDAYATLDLGAGSTVTLGKFLSYLGYESFYPALMDQVSYANGDFLAPVPAYHTGAKYDFAEKTFGFGVAAIDSVYSPYGPTRGDGELKHNGGFEGYFTFTGIENLTLWAGFAHDTKGNFQPHSVTTIDVWASYQLTKQIKIAAEYINKDGGYVPSVYNNKGHNWLTYLNYAFSDKVSSVFRISGEEMSNGGPRFVKYTVAPTYNVNANFLLRAEYSYYDYKNYASSSADFFGVQAVFKF
jgi:hypothetical protein